MNRLIARNLRQRKAQVSGMVITVAVCSMVFVSLFLLATGLQRGVALNEQRGGADLVVVPSEASAWVTDSELLFGGAPVLSYFPEEVVASIAQVEGVKAVTVQFYGQTLAEGCCSNGEEARIIGFNPVTDWVVSPYASRDLTTLAADEIVVGCKVDGFTNGTATLLGKTFWVVDTLEETGSSLDFSILVNIDVVRELVKQSDGFAHFWTEYGQPETIVSAVLVDVTDGSVAASVMRKIRKLGDFTVLQRASVVEESQKTLNALFAVMTAMGVVLAVASLLQFFTRYYSSVWERKAELALYRALGASAADLRKVICGEAFAITALGVVVGIVGGVVLSAAGYAYLQTLGAFPFSALPLGWATLGIAGIAVAFFLFTALSIVTPLRQVAKIDPAAAMQQVDIG